MARDYKPAKKKRKKRRGAASHWKWLFIGLLIGAGSGTLIYYYYNHRFGMAAHHATDRAAAPRTKAASKRSARRETAPEPHFDFYTLLPEMEVVIPDRPQSVPGRMKPSGGGKGGTFILQAGSFRRYSDADSLKARLALLGIESRIQTVAINGKETWHRVRIGPFHDPRKLNQTRARLKRHHINSVRLKSLSGD